MGEVAVGAVDGVVDAAVGGAALVGEVAGGVVGEVVVGSLDDGDVVGEVVDGAELAGAGAEEEPPPGTMGTSPVPV